jgi:WD40 repeat protein
VFIKVWNSRTEEHLHTLTQHENKVFILENHPSDPTIVMSAGYDGMVVLWNIKGGIFQLFWKDCNVLMNY